MTASTGIRFLWFGSYAKGPGYPRSDTLVAGLRALGHEVEEVHAPLFRSGGDRLRVGRGRSLVGAAWRQCSAAAGLSVKWFRAAPRDVVVVGAGGLSDVVLLRFLQNVHRVPVVLDAFVPLYDTVVRDRRLAPPESLRARALLRLERLSARWADLVLCDTAANGRLLQEDLLLVPGKLAVVPVSQVDPGPSSAMPVSGDLRVLLVATYIPLHGIDTVIQAARQIAGRGVEIEIVGTGQLYGELAPAAANVPGLTLTPRFLAPDEIRERLARAHVGLGVFGTTQKAGRVVPLKAALTLACGRALVTRESPAAREALEGAAVLVPPGDPGALARALTELAADRDRVSALAAAGRRRFEERFAPRRVAERLVAALGDRGLVGAYVRSPRGDACPPPPSSP